MWGGAVCTAPAIRVIEFEYHSKVRLGGPFFFSFPGSGMLTLPEGFAIGHWTDKDARTGCTVVLCPSGTIGGCDVRGASPGTRELMLLRNDKTMQQVNAVLLTGGSAFGLAAADGVMRFLEEKGMGYQTSWAKVPIVPAAVIFDLNIGTSTVRPTADSGYRACTTASSTEIELGNIGAGTGATVGKWAGIEYRMEGGIGIERISAQGIDVVAIAVVNAVGDILDGQGKIIAGARSRSGRWLAEKDPLRTLKRTKSSHHTNTTLVAVISNARLSKVELNRVAERGHDGMARAVRPVHTSFDGDIVFALSSGAVDAGDVDLVAEMGAEATARAIRHGVKASSRQ